MATTLQIQPLPLPFKLDKTGVARVGGTRVTLDTVVRAFVRGATAEEIAQQYPSLILSDIYATISYYLQNQKRWKSTLKNAESMLKPSNAKIKKGSINLEFGKDYWRVKTNSNVARRRPRKRISTMTSSRVYFGERQIWILSVYKIWD